MALGDVETSWAGGQWRNRIEDLAGDISAHRTQADATKNGGEDARYLCQSVTGRDVQHIVRRHKAAPATVTSTPP